MIEQTNLKAAYLADKAEIDEAMARVAASGWYILGEEVGAFEKEWAAWLGCGHAIGVGSGTDALVLALKAVGVGPDTSVVTVSHTAVATVAAIEMCGAVPILIDVMPDTYTMDCRELLAVMEGGANVRPIQAVLPVHIYGQMAPLYSIAMACSRHGKALVDDCCQAHGATLGPLHAGSIADISAFSFYPTKNLGAIGDGGAVTTNDDALAEKVRALRQYGWKTRYVSEAHGGINSRLDELQAAILRARLPKLTARNERRRVISAIYDQTLIEAHAPRPVRFGGHANHLYVLEVEDRKGFQTVMMELGAVTNIHYPVPVHLQPAYKGRVKLGPSGCRETERLAARIVSLPLHPEMTDQEVDAVCYALRLYFGATRETV
jgi:dTDP-4-amino-4,6-dideoxygalactose transaminase